MVRKLCWTLRALGRLDEIDAHIAKDNPTRSTSFVREIREKANILKVHLPGTPGRVFGTKELVLHKHYLAVYRVKDDQVEILTILHTAQNQ